MSVVPWLIAVLSLLVCGATLATFRHPRRTELRMHALLVAALVVALAAFVAPPTAWWPLVPLAGVAVGLFGLPVPPPPPAPPHRAGTEDPPWWPEFEEGFRQAVREHEGDAERP